MVKVCAFGKGCLIQRDDAESKARAGGSSNRGATALEKPFVFDVLILQFSIVIYRWITTDSIRCKIIFKNLWTNEH